MTNFYFSAVACRIVGTQDQQWALNIFRLLHTQDVSCQDLVRCFPCSTLRRFGRGSENARKPNSFVAFSCSWPSSATSYDRLFHCPIARLPHFLVNARRCRHRLVLVVYKWNAIVCYGLLAAEVILCSCCWHRCPSLLIRQLRKRRLLCGRETCSGLDRGLFLTMINCCAGGFGSWTFGTILLASQRSNSPKCSVHYTLAQGILKPQ